MAQINSHNVQEYVVAGLQHIQDNIDFKQQLRQKLIEILTETHKQIIEETVDSYLVSIASFVEILNTQVNPITLSVNPIITASIISDQTVVKQVLTTVGVQVDSGQYTVSKTHNINTKLIED